MIKLFMPKKNKNKNGIIMRRTLRNISIIFFIISITVFAQNNADFFFERGVEKIKELLSTNNEQPEIKEKDSCCSCGGKC